MVKPREDRQLNKPSAANKVALGVLRAFDGLVDLLVLLFILLLIAFGVFSLWDTHRLYQAAAPTVLETYKPDREPYLSFEELIKINPDVFAWITIYGTNIDYPVTQADDNDKYINTSATGDFALYGCPFLDHNNAADFSDLNSIIYAHHMDKGMMFGDLDLFLEKSFFDEHEFGNIYFGGKQHGLHIFAAIEADAYDFTIYDIGVNEESQSAYLEHIGREAKFKRDGVVKEGDHVILLSTCAGGLTNLRYILACKLTDKTYEDPFYVEPTVKEGLPFFLTLPVWWYIGAGLLVILFILLLILTMQRRKKKQEGEISENGENLADDKQDNSTKI